MKQVLLIICITLLVSCNSSESWYPLTVGNYWIYQESNGDVMKILVNSTQAISNISTYEVQRIAVKGLFAGTGAYQTVYMNENKGGVFNVAKKAGDEIFEFKTPNYELRFPLQPGKIWEYTPVYKNREANPSFNWKVKSEVLSKDEFVDTPVGQFKATKIKVEVGKITYYRWYVSGLGMVKEVNQIGDHKREKVLTEYYLNHQID